MLTRWEQAVLAYVEDLEYVTSTAILLDALPWIARADWSMEVYKQLGRLLRQHGWQRAPWRDTDGYLVKGYQRRLPGPL